MSYTIATEETPSKRGRERVASSAYGFSAVLGESPELKACVESARCAAGLDSGPILLVGEPGTGKELIARACHFDGERASEAFVILDCRALDPKLFESELFGSESGAIPGLLGGRQGLLETAGSGTLLLRRVDEMPISLQPRLVSTLAQSMARRVGGLEEFAVRCRIVASASPRIANALEEGRFREDLYDKFRESVVHVPPLRDRGDDLMVLAEHFQTLSATAEGLPNRAFGDQARAALAGREWKGNVRELKRVIQQAVVTALGESIDACDFPFGPSRPSSPVGPDGEIMIVIPPAGRTLEEVEAEVIAATLQLTGGNKSATARILGISRPTLRRKARLYAVETG